MRCQKKEWLYYPFPAFRSLRGGPAEPILSRHFWRYARLRTTDPGLLGLLGLLGPLVGSDFLIREAFANTRVPSFFLPPWISSSSGIFWCLGCLGTVKLKIATQCLPDAVPTFGSCRKTSSCCWSPVSGSLHAIGQTQQEKEENCPSITIVWALPHIYIPSICRAYASLSASHLMVGKSTFPIQTISIILERDERESESESEDQFRRYFSTCGSAKTWLFQDWKTEMPWKFWMILGVAPLCRHHHSGCAIRGIVQASRPISSSRWMDGKLCGKNLETFARFLPHTHTYTCIYTYTCMLTL